MKMKIFALVGLLFLAKFLMAQDQIFKGRVIDSKGHPIPGITVLIKGTAKGTTTDADGKFEISATSNAILVFSFVGYKSIEVALGSRAEIDVVMDEEIDTLEDPYYCCIDDGHKAAPHCGKDQEKLKKKFHCTKFRKE